MYFTNNAIAPYKRKQRKDSLKKRHNDGIKDIGVQIKQKARELVSYFKQLPNSKKAVLIISQIGKIVAILLAKSAGGDALTQEDKILRDKLRKRIEDLKVFSEMRGFDASETINKKQEQLNPIESKDTRFKLKLFISLVTTFASLIGDFFVLRSSKQDSIQRRDKAIKHYIDRAVRKHVRLALKDAGVKGMKKGQHVKARDPEYVESLKGGNGNRPQATQPAQKKQLQKPSTLKRAAVIGGALAGTAGLGLLAAKVGGRMGSRMAAKTARKAVSSPSVKIAKKSKGITASKSNSYKTHRYNQNVKSNLNRNQRTTSVKKNRVSPNRAVNFDLSNSKKFAREMNNKRHSFAF